MLLLRVRGGLRQHPRDGSQLHPPLLLRSLGDIRTHARQLGQIGELNVAATQPNKRCARRVVAGLGAQEVDAIGGSLGGMDAVEGRGVATFLEWAENSLADIEAPGAFGFE